MDVSCLRCTRVQRGGPRWGRGKMTFSRGSARLQPTNRLDLEKFSSFLFFLITTRFPIHSVFRILARARACVCCRRGGADKRRRSKEARRRKRARRLPLIAALIDPHSPRRRGEADVFRVSTRLSSGGGGGGR